MFETLQEKSLIHSGLVMSRFDEEEEWNIVKTGSQFGCHRNPQVSGEEIEEIDL